MQTPPDSRMRFRQASLVAALLCAVASIPLAARAEISIQDRHDDLPILLNQPEDYVLKNVRISGLIDTAALTLEGRIKSVTIENSKFGDITAGGNNVAASLLAVNATVGAFKATDSAFYDAENQLASLRDGSFGTVTFMHCSFKTSDAFIKKIYESNPWRHTPPTTEFYNIQRLELLDNEFSNTTIVIHPSVKMVIFRGDLSQVRVESPDTEVILMDPLMPGMPALPTSPENPVYASAGNIFSGDSTDEIQTVEYERNLPGSGEMDAKHSRSMSDAPDEPSQESSMMSPLSQAPACAGKIERTLPQRLP